MLCLCAWRGPVPVVHCHDVELGGLAVEGYSDWALAEHVAACHAGEPAHGEEGWHVHFVLPTSSDGDLPSAEPILAEMIVQDVEGQQVEVPVSSRSLDPLVDVMGPFTQPSLSPTVPS